MPVSTSNHWIAACVIFSRFVSLEFFLFPRLQRALKDHRYADNRVIQMTVTKQLCSIPVLSVIASETPRNTGSGAFMQELFRRKSLAPECKDTVLNFVPPVSELSGLLLYFLFFFKIPCDYYRQVYFYVTDFFRNFSDICCIFYPSINNPVSITDRSKTFPLLC